MFPKGILIAVALALTGRAAAGQLAHEDARSICTADDTRPARCYELSEPEIYTHARAVARLSIGTLHCSGFLVGAEGHLLTASHCIPDAAAAAITVVELGAEGATCATDCSQPLSCSGEVVATGVTLVRTNSLLDYSLVRLPVNPTPAYGYLRLRAGGAVVGERIYNVQHPGGEGKRIAAASSYPADGDGFPHVSGVAEPACQAVAGWPFLGSFLDTRPGASGSPILAYADHLVVAQHGCRALLLCATGLPESDSPNRAIPSPALIADLGPDLPPSAVYEPVFRDGFEVGDASAWTLVKP